MKSYIETCFCCRYYSSVTQGVLPVSMAYPMMSAQVSALLSPSLKQLHCSSLQHGGSAVQAELLWRISARQAHESFPENTVHRTHACSYNTWRPRQKNHTRGLQELQNRTLSQKKQKPKNNSPPHKSPRNLFK